MVAVLTRKRGRAAQPFSDLGRDHWRKRAFAGSPLIDDPVRIVGNQNYVHEGTGIRTFQTGDAGWDGGALTVNGDEVLDRNWLRLKRPYIDGNDDLAVTLNLGRTTLDKGKQVPICEHITANELYERWQIMLTRNATTLRKEEWALLDTTVLRAARYPLVFWQDLLSDPNLVYGGFNGMSKTVLEWETMTDPGEAFVDIDGLTEGRTDAAKFQLEAVPLFITHVDFWNSSRFISISRNTGTPYDATMGEAAGRRISEKIEKTAIGNNTGVTYGAGTQIGGYGRTSQVYGLVNFTPRITKTNLTAPILTNGTSNTNWTPQTTQQEVALAIQKLRYHKFNGPFAIYYSPDWGPYLDGDYYVSITSGAVAPTKTLKERLLSLDGVKSLKYLPFLFDSTTDKSAGGPGLEEITTPYPFHFLIVQMTPDVIQAVTGMDITTVQWESVGGMRLNFKVMCIQVPRLRADNYGNCGIEQCSTTLFGTSTSDTFT
jgi:hypothetical protein